MYCYSTDVCNGIALNQVELACGVLAVQTRCGHRKECRQSRTAVLRQSAAHGISARSQSVKYASQIFIKPSLPSVSNHNSGSVKHSFHPYTHATYATYATRATQLRKQRKVFISPVLHLAFRTLRASRPAGRRGLVARS